MNLDYLKELLADVKAAGTARVSVCEGVKTKLEDAFREMKMDDDRLSSLDFPKKMTEPDVINRFFSSRSLLQAILESKIKILEVRSENESFSESHSGPEHLKAISEAMKTIEEHETTIAKQNELIETKNKRIRVLEDQVLVSRSELQNILIDIGKVSRTINKLIS